MRCAGSQQIHDGSFLANQCHSLKRSLKTDTSRSQGDSKPLRPEQAGLGAGWTTYGGPAFWLDEAGIATWQVPRQNRGQPAAKDLDPAIEPVLRSMIHSRFRTAEGGNEMLATLIDVCVRHARGVSDKTPMEPSAGLRLATGCSGYRHGRRRPATGSSPALFSRPAMRGSMYDPWAPPPRKSVRAQRA